MGFVVNIKGKNLMILSTMVYAFWSAWNIVAVPVPTRILGMVPVFWYKSHMSSSSVSAEVLGINLPAAGEYGVGMVFAHKYESLRNEQKQILEEVVREEGASCSRLA